MTEEYCCALRARTVHLIPTIRKNAETFARAAAVGVGTQPHGITAYDPARGLLFCANQGSNNVSVIDDETGGAGGGSSAASAIGNLLIVVVAVGLVMVVLMLAAQHSGRRR